MMRFIDGVLAEFSELCEASNVGTAIFGTYVRRIFILERHFVSLITKSLAF